MVFCHLYGRIFQYKMGKTQLYVVDLLSARTDESGKVKLSVVSANPYPMIHYRIPKVTVQRRLQEKNRNSTTRSHFLDQLLFKDLKIQPPPHIRRHPESDFSLITIVA